MEGSARRGERLQFRVWSRDWLLESAVCVVWAVRCRECDSRVTPQHHPQGRPWLAATKEIATDVAVVVADVVGVAEKAIGDAPVIPDSHSAFCRSQYEFWKEDG